VQLANPAPVGNWLLSVCIFVHVCMCRLVMGMYGASELFYSYELMTVSILMVIIKVTMTVTLELYAGRGKDAEVLSKHSGS